MLGIDDLISIKRYYEAACTAEYLEESYGIDTERALAFGYEARRLMNKYEYSETEAIEKLLADSSALNGQMICGGGIGRHCRSGTSVNGSC